MMRYDFDKIIDRKNTQSLKHDFNKVRFGREDILPMWVADMDFEAPDFITKAIKKRMDHPVYGYTIPPNSLSNSIIDWIEDLHGWRVRKSWMTLCTGVVPALHFCVRAFTKPGDRIIVQPPVYYPFFGAVEDNDRLIQHNPLMIVNGRYEMDFDDLERNTDERTKLLFLCSPHNPGGRVWSKDTLEQLAEFCIQKNIIIISDEIHADMVFFPYRHVPLASISEKISKQTITLMAPTKTFNLAGLAFSYIISQNTDLLGKLNAYLNRTGVNHVNIFAMIATEAAYRYGKEWLIQLMAYLKMNYDYLEQFINNNLPRLRVMRPEATYLAWIDFNNSGIERSDIKKFIIEKAGLGLNDGATFGKGGEGFQRLNFACPKKILEKGLTNLQISMNN